MRVDDNKVREILATAKVVAVVGASRSPDKDAGRVPRYLISAGYEVVPINPSADHVAGVKAYPSLLEVPPELASRLDIVDVFRPPEEALEIVRQANELRRRYGRPKVIWFQYGTWTSEAVEEAERLGFIVVYERCMMEEHRRLFKIRGQS
ncbi:MAG: CoA-binding protein [Thermoproteota archaeon]